MKGHLLAFTFAAIFLDLGYNFTLDKIHAHFSQSLWLQQHWIGPYVVAPALLLIALAFTFGFFRPKGPRWADAAALAVTALLVYMTLGAGYSCWHYCF
jgi:hypothetical protein